MSLKGRKRRQHNEDRALKFPLQAVTTADVCRAWRLVGVPGAVGSLTCRWNRTNIKRIETLSDLLSSHRYEWNPG
jgi:hypothetical protein